MLGYKVRNHARQCIDRIFSDDNYAEMLSVNEISHAQDRGNAGNNIDILIKVYEEIIAESS